MDRPKFDQYVIRYELPFIIACTKVGESFFLERKQKKTCFEGSSSHISARLWVSMRTPCDLDFRLNFQVFHGRECSW